MKYEHWLRYQPTDEKEKQMREYKCVDVSIYEDQITDSLAFMLFLGDFMSGRFLHIYI